MTLSETVDIFYRKQIEEHYAPFIKDRISNLLVMSLSERPANVKVMKNKERVHAQDTQEDPAILRYHEIHLGDIFRVYVWPAKGLISISISEDSPKPPHVKTNSPSLDFRNFLSFSIQKELFSNLGADYAPIKKANLEDINLVESFITELKELKL